MVPHSGELEAEVTLGTEDSLSWVRAVGLGWGELTWRVAGLDSALDADEQCAQVLGVIFTDSPKPGQLQGLSRYNLAL